MLDTKKIFQKNNYKKEAIVFSNTSFECSQQLSKTFIINKAKNIFTQESRNFNTSITYLVLWKLPEFNKNKNIYTYLALFKAATEHEKKDRARLLMMSIYGK